MVRCTVPREVGLARLTARSARPDVSDATPEVLARMAELVAPWTSGLQVDMTRPVEAVRDHVRRALVTRPFPVPPSGPS